MLQGRYVFLASNTSARWSISDIGMDNRGRKGIFALTIKNVALEKGSGGAASNRLKQLNIYGDNSQDYRQCMSG
ncbi:MAG: hypothetical protein BGP09_07115 [Rhizobium sp. 60-20]|nr:MAG: hypothetical protein BGP09_07115 [Rhizobium sp. 60-20]